MKVRYTRWWERLLALVQPSRRRRLRIVRAIAAETEPLRNELARDLFLYGSAFVGPDGRRIDPTTVRISK